MTTTELSQRMTAFDPKAMTAFATGVPKVHAGPKVARYRARMKDLETAGKLGPGNTQLAGRVRKLRGTDVESKLVTPEVAQLAGFNPKEPVSKSGLETASPFGRMNPMFRRALERRSLLGRAKRHACRTEGPDGDHLVNLARKAQALFGAVDPKDAAAVKDHREDDQWARKEYSVGVFSHEFGHLGRGSGTTSPARSTRSTTTRATGSFARRTARSRRRARRVTSTARRASALATSTRSRTRRSTAASTASLRRPSWTTRATRRSTCT